MVKSKLRSKINSSNRLHNRLCSGLSLVQAQLNSPLWKMRISMLCWHPVAYMKLSLFHLVKHSRTLFWNNFWKTEQRNFHFTAAMPGLVNYSLLTSSFFLGWTWCRRSSWKDGSSWSSGTSRKTWPWRSPGHSWPCGE